MKIDAKVVKTFDTGNVKAICDVTLDNAFAVHGVKLIKGQNPIPRVTCIDTTVKLQRNTMDTTSPSLTCVTPPSRTETICSTS